MSIHDASLAQKVKARKAVSHALADGRLQRQPCEKCGAIRAQAHHDDYSKPLLVRWLCSKCHCRLHNQKYPTEKLCQVCGASFVPHATKRKRAKTCSPTCRAAAISRALLVKPVVPPWAKLSYEKADRIRSQYAAGGTSHRTLAREHGVHHRQIGSIIRGEAWVRPVAVALSVAQRKPA